MLYFSQTELIYVGQTQDEKGSPKEMTFSRTVKVKEIKNFSVNYYTNQQRSMRVSKNLVVPKWMTWDFEENGIKYELMYVIYNGLKYRIREIMKYYKTDLRVILDVQEI